MLLYIAVIVTLILFISIYNAFKNKQNMAVLDDLIAKLTADVAAETTEVASAIVFINGVPALITNAVNAALAAGATAEQLAALTALSTSLEAETPALTAALTANAPAAPAS